MYKRWKLHLVAPAACAVVMMACGGTDGAREKQARGPQENSAPQAGTSGSQPTYKLTGCLEAATGENNYTLRHVRLESREPQPQSDLTGNQGPAITEGSWVRLTSDSDNLKNYLGQRVKVTGSILDDGSSRIGATGTSGVETPSGARSQASTDQHHSRKEAKEAGRIARNTIANGTAPQVTVQSIYDTASKCDTSVR